KKDKDLRAKSKDDVVKLKSQYARDLLGVRATMIRKLLTILDGKTSKGVKHKFGDEIISKGVKFNEKNIEQNLFPPKNPYRDESNYNVPEEANLISDIILDDWTDDPHPNELVQQLVKNY